MADRGPLHCASRVSHSRPLHRAFWISPILLLLTTVAVCQDSVCRSTQTASIPSRPTIASATDTTQCGVVELEYGLERQWLDAGARHSDFSGGIRFGLTPKLDLHWFAGNFHSFTDATGTRSGYGDNWFGLKYRLTGQTAHRPSLGLLYQAKAPTGDGQLGCSGKVDHAFAFLVSKDVKPFHFDFNLIPQLIANPSSTGFDHNFGFAWATWLPVTKRLTLVAEPYGFTALNEATAGFSSVMAGSSFRAHQRLYLDAGIDFGASQWAPQKRVFGGITYAVSNVYTWLRPRQ